LISCPAISASWQEDIAFLIFRDNIFIINERILNINRYKNVAKDGTIP
jgi:hypothetical protein